MIDLHVETSGSGETVLLAHGFGGSARNFRPQVKALRGRYRVITWDARGHARSGAPGEARAYAPECFVSDLARVLVDEGGAGQSLAERLQPYATGSHSSLFARPTSARPEGQLICFSLRGLPERLKAPVLLLCLDAIWRSLEGPLRQRCVLVDEAWLLMREPAGARFLFRLAKQFRCFTHRPSPLPSAGE